MTIPNTQQETSYRNSQLLPDSNQVERMTSTVYSYRSRRRTNQIIRVLPPPSGQTSMWSANNSRLFKLAQRQSRTTYQKIKKLYQSKIIWLKLTSQPIVFQMWRLNRQVQYNMIFIPWWISTIFMARCEKTYTRIPSMGMCHRIMPPPFIKSSRPTHSARVLFRHKRDKSSN